MTGLWYVKIDLIIKEEEVSQIKIYVKNITCFLQIIKSRVKKKSDGLCFFPRGLWEHLSPCLF